MGGFCRHVFAASGGTETASRAVRDTDRAGVAACRHRGVRAAPDQAAIDTPARLSALSTGTRWRLSPVLSRPQRGARLQRNLRAGIPAERHRHRAPHELLLARRLEHDPEKWMPVFGKDHAQTER